eukprot:scaffold6247_cov416-Prasinococcus_capsulatus_cf.AAC.3
MKPPISSKETAWMNRHPVPTSAGKYQPDRGACGFCTTDRAGTTPLGAVCRGPRRAQHNTACRTAPPSSVSLHKAPPRSSCKHEACSSSRPWPGRGTGRHLACPRSGSHSVGAHPCPFVRPGRRCTISGTSFGRGRGRCGIGGGAASCRPYRAHSVVVRQHAHHDQPAGGPGSPRTQATAPRRRSARARSATFLQHTPGAPSVWLQRRGGVPWQHIESPAMRADMYVWQALRRSFRHCSWAEALRYMLTDSE